jgi:hypothetical protein
MNLPHTALVSTLRPSASACQHFSFLCRSAHPRSRMAERFHATALHQESPARQVASQEVIDQLLYTVLALHDDLLSAVPNETYTPPDVSRETGSSRSPARAPVAR